jgi:hypothetical protein
LSACDYLFSGFECHPEFLVFNGLLGVFCELIVRHAECFVNFLNCFCVVCGIRSEMCELWNLGN